MRRIRRLAGAVLAAVLAVTVMAGAALADSVQTVEPANEADRGAGSITVENPAVGETYKIYRLFDATVTENDPSGDGVSIAYTGQIPAGLEPYFAVDTAGNIEATPKAWVNPDAYPLEMSPELRAALVTWAHTAAGTPVAQATVAEGTTSLVFSNLKFGYYVIDSSQGTAIAVDSTTPNAVVQEKNAAPAVEKLVEEDANSVFGKVNDADLQQQVNFRSVVVVQTGAQQYVYHDFMDAGLTFDPASVAVQWVRQGSDAATDLAAGIDYTVVSPGTGDASYPAGVSSCTFEVRFEQSLCNQLQTGDYLVVSYAGTLNENAVVADEGNLNTGWVSYGDEGGTISSPSTTTTYTWGLAVYKFNGRNNPLAGATFTLSTETGDTPLTFTKIDGDGNDFRFDPSGSVTEFTSNDQGGFSLTGLDSGTYYLTEVKAPDGYNLLSKPVKVVISTVPSENGSKLTGTVSYDFDNGGGLAQAPQDIIPIQNLTGAELPSTGGVGTTVFYIVGGVLVVGAVALLVVKRRAGSGK